MRRIGGGVTGAVVGAVVTATLASLPWSHSTATAACPVPAVKFRPTRVARGATVTIAGQHFGDGCPDTGTLPAGVGELGDPLTGLVLVIDQGDREYVVANGSANDAFEFS